MQWIQFAAAWSLLCKIKKDKGPKLCSKRICSNINQITISFRDVIFHNGGSPSCNAASNSIGWKITTLHIFKKSPLPVLTVRERSETYFAGWVIHLMEAATTWMVNGVASQDERRSIGNAINAGGTLQRPPFDSSLYIRSQPNFLPNAFPFGCAGADFPASALNVYTHNIYIGNERSLCVFMKADVCVCLRFIMYMRGISRARLCRRGCIRAMELH